MNNIFIDVVLFLFCLALAGAALKKILSLAENNLDGVIKKDRPNSLKMFLVNFGILFLTLIITRYLASSFAIFTCIYVMCGLYLNKYFLVKSPKMLNDFSQFDRLEMIIFQSWFFPIPIINLVIQNKK